MSRCGDHATPRGRRRSRRHTAPVTWHAEHSRQTFHRCMGRRREELVETSLSSPTVFGSVDIGAVSVRDTPAADGDAVVRRAVGHSCKRGPGRRVSRNRSSRSQPRLGGQRFGHGQRRVHRQPGAAQAIDLRGETLCRPDDRLGGDRAERGRTSPAASFAGCKPVQCGRHIAPVVTDAWLGSAHGASSVVAHGD
jgi:hypothetical protein